MELHPVPRRGIGASGEVRRVAVSLADGDRGETEPDSGSGGADRARYATVGPTFSPQLTPDTTTSIRRSTPFRCANSTVSAGYPWTAIAA